MTTVKIVLNSRFSSNKPQAELFLTFFFLYFLDEEGNGQTEAEERLPDLPLLSEQLLLDELWDMLGECLKELEESHDQHAVLGWWLCFWGIILLPSWLCFHNWLFSFIGVVLQPAVEAFFLVHATERESKPPVRDTRESQLSHIKDEPPPLSPAPLTPATPSSLDPFFSREPSSMHISSNLPPDTQKFLRFAGECDASWRMNTPSVVHLGFVMKLLLAF